ncbi:MAG: biotin attachment protein [Lentisphaeria bacterium]|nr:biotin attachment protein [Lentisphaeria bacterium]
MKKIRFMDTSFRDGFQSLLGARVLTEDFQPALAAAVEAGIDWFEIGGGARFQSLYFYCQEDAFEMMDRCRRTVGPEVNLQTLSRGANVVGLVSQSRDIIDLHAKLFAKHGITSIRNFDALNDVRNLDYSGRCIKKHGLKHQVSVTLMGLPPGTHDAYAHSAAFYADTLKKILEAEIPFDSVCFKDASGTATPRTVHETILLARDILGKDGQIHFHTHCTAGSGPSCLMAAIEAGADIIDLSMAPLSGGTGHTDILTMWHILRGTDYTLDIDYEKVLLAEETFKECMAKYFMGIESKETNPLIVLSPMPGGALTTNTLMMRDNNCMHLYNDVIKAMREVVERGGFGTSVTPVSQFYFQQAFVNVTQGPWKKITDGYGDMVLGYFGRTPSAPDPEIVRLAEEQLGKPHTQEDVHDINDRDPKLGIAPATRKLQDAGLPATEENIFIIATCGDKGLAFLQGKAPLSVPLLADEERNQTEKFLKKNKGVAAEIVKSLGLAPEAPVQAHAAAGPASYVVTVNGLPYHVDVAPAAAGAMPHVTQIRPLPAAQAPSPAPAADPAPTAAAGTPSTAGTEIGSPMPGTVLRVTAGVGDEVKSGDTLLVIEAMKMEQEIKSTVAGKVMAIDVSVGETVESNQVVAVIG